MRMRSIVFQESVRENSLPWPRDGMRIAWGGRVSPVAAPSHGASDTREKQHKMLRLREDGYFSNRLRIIRRSMALMCVAVAMVIFNPGQAFPLFGFSEEESNPKESAEAIPPEYQGKQMPSGWLTDPKVIAAGKAIYEGKTNPKVKCALCHGEDGTPTRIGRGAPDFSDPSEARVSDAQWFWKISEGKRRTKMRSHKKHLTEEQRWRVIAYMRTFAQ